MGKQLNVCNGTPVRLVGPGPSGSGGIPAGGDWFVTNWQEISQNDSDKVFGPVPDGMEYQILWIQVNFITSAVVGDRQLEVRMERPASAMPGPEGTLAKAGAVQAASADNGYIFAPGLADLTSVRDSDYLTTPIPVTSLLQAGDQLRIYDNNAVDAAADDMYIYIQYAYRRV